MRIQDLNERAMPMISDKERYELINFMLDWLGGSFMRTQEDHLDMWNRLRDLFPHRASRPVALMRLVTLPIEFADQKSFHLPQPAPKSVGSWTSTRFGLESVHGITTEDGSQDKTCRIAIAAKIDPQNILMTSETLKRALLTLTRDYHWEEETRGKDGRSQFKEYLGSVDDMFHNQLDYIVSTMRDFKGGYMRQYEYIVRTTPLDVRNIMVFRKGDEVLKYGHDDPHNSDDFRGWVND